MSAAAEAAAATAAPTAEEQERAFSNAMAHLLGRHASVARRDGQRIEGVLMGVELEAQGLAAQLVVPGSTQPTTVMCAAADIADVSDDDSAAQSAQQDKKKKKRARAKQNSQKAQQASQAPAQAQEQATPQESTPPQTAEQPQQPQQQQQQKTCVSIYPLLPGVCSRHNLHWQHCLLLLCVHSTRHLKNKQESYAEGWDGVIHGTVLFSKCALRAV